MKGLKKNFEIYMYDAFCDSAELFNLMTQSQDTVERRKQVMESAKQLKAAWHVVSDLTGGGSDDMTSVRITSSSLILSAIVTHHASY